MINRRRVASIGALTAVSIGVASFCVVAEADRRWGEWSTRADALQEQLHDADALRPVLFGAATPGNAWKAYATAVTRAVEDRQLEEQVRPWARAELDPSRLAELLDAHAETLAWLHRGAHCEQTREPIDWSQGFSGSAHSLLALRGLSNLAVAQALAQIEAEQPVAAVETLLNAAQLGRDLMHSHLMFHEAVGCAVIHIPTSGATQSNDLLERLSPAALARFAEGLTVLDEHIARVGPALRGEAVLFARTAMNNPQLFGEHDLSAGSWRYGFSTRLMFADTGLNVMDLADRTVAAAREPWSVCRAYLSSTERRVLVAGNTMLSRVAGVQRTALIMRFRTVARLRLLRMAIEHQRKNPIPRLADPFGDTLQHAVNAEGKTEFWGVGPDGSRLLLWQRRGR